MSTIGEYEPVKTLGKGSYGVAVLVKHKTTGALAVTKEILTQSMEPSEITRCAKEMDILREICHPNVVSHIDSVQNDKTIVILMEYCDGGDLGNKLKPNTPLPTNEIILYTVQMVLGLHYLHHVKKILHRDLKPQNIFLMANGLVKVGDFGVSTILHRTSDCANTFCGTPYYLSPELCQDKPYNSKADMWALGCILYEMCVGKRPFVRRNIVELAECINRAEYDPIPLTVDEGLREIIAALLQRVPEVRPSAYRLLRSRLIQHHLALLSRDGGPLDFPEAKLAVVIPKPQPKVAVNVAERGCRQEEIKSMQEYVEMDRQRIESAEAEMGFSKGSFDMSSELRTPTKGMGDSSFLDDVITDTDRPSTSRMRDRKYVF